ncbi:hypothetical protein EI067_15405 [Mycobacterium paragordonae]|uniref:hypothetical protein n=1 Tax=Mycobacterium paragordonae TaxID=1389713 RepID=UPI0010614C75|nr:hypothetical protein [Mycobacterium paragordonae]TDK96488.1 hypothetical protein EI067_15405 [Mycobacterium paragordonae]
MREDASEVISSYDHPLDEFLRLCLVREITGAAREYAACLLLGQQLLPAELQRRRLLGLRSDTRPAHRSLVSASGPMITPSGKPRFGGIDLAYSALVLQLLLSAPGDLPEEHKSLIQRSIRLWNNQQARFYGIHFSSTDWKEGGTPEFGDYAQGVLNEQIVDDSDAAVVVFTDRLGTPTRQHESGTAEEIARMREAGKDVGVLLNHCRRSPLSGSAVEEKARLDKYIQTIGQQAFIGQYDSEQRLTEVMNGLLTRIAGKYRREADRSLTPSSTPEGDLDEEEPEDASRGVWPRIEVSESVESDSRGQVRTRRKWSLVLESNIDKPVRDVTFRYEDGQGNVLKNFDLRWDRHDKVDVLPPHGSVRFPMIQAWGSPRSALCVVKWIASSGESHETRATVRTS